MESGNKRTPLTICCERNDSEALRVILDFIPLNDPKVEKKVAKEILNSGDPKSIEVLKLKLGERTFRLYSSKHLQSVKRSAMVPLNLTSACDINEFLLSHRSKPTEPSLAEWNSKALAFEGSSNFAKETRKSINWFEEGFECSVDSESIDECLWPVAHKNEEALARMTALVEKTEMVG